MTQPKPMVHKTEDLSYRILPLIGHFANYKPLIDDLNILFSSSTGILDQPRFRGGFKDVAAMSSLSSVANDYRERILVIARHYGLDRLPKLDLDDPNAISLGVEHIHGYCVSRTINDLTGGSQSCRSMFISGAGVTTNMADSYEHQEVLQIEVSWDPSLETVATAMKRNLKLFRSQFNDWARKIKRDPSHEELVKSVKPPADRDIEWLFRKLALEESFQMIADLADRAVGDYREMVQAAVNRAADKLGIDRRGW